MLLHSGGSAAQLVPKDGARVDSDLRPAFGVFARIQCIEAEASVEVKVRLNNSQCMLGLSLNQVANSR